MKFRYKIMAFLLVFISSSFILLGCTDNKDDASKEGYKIVWRIKYTTDGKQKMQYSTYGYQYDSPFGKQLTAEEYEASSKREYKTGGNLSRTHKVLTKSRPHYVRSAQKTETDDLKRYRTYYDQTHIIDYTVIGIPIYAKYYYEHTLTLQYWDYLWVKIVDNSTIKIRHGSDPETTYTVTSYSLEYFYE